MNRRQVYWLFQIGGWGCYLLLFVFANIIDAPADEPINYVAFVPVIVEVLVLMATSHGIRYIIRRQGWLERPVLKAIPRVLVVLIVLAIPIYPIKLGVSAAVGLYSPNMWEQMLFSTLTYVAFFFLWVVFYFLFHYIDSYNKSLQLEAAVNEMELANLKSQLNPHFIFNALNSIRALVDENPGRSKMAINQLSNILRKSLTSDKTGMTNFEDEFKTVQDYLNLESTRFEERLSVEFDVDPKSYNYTIPSMMLQTLVENGIKHGISNLKEGGKIGVCTKVFGGRMEIQIRNTGQYLNGVKTSTGLGLKNTEQRLKLIYGEEADFSIINEDTKTVLTTVTIPKTGHI